MPPKNDEKRIQAVKSHSLFDGDLLPRVHPLPQHHTAVGALPQLVQRDVPVHDLAHRWPASPRGGRWGTVENTLGP